LPDFLKGFCPTGAECKLKHFFEKSPEKSKSKETDKSKESEVVMREKKIAPAKPKRKSICQTPMSEKKARVRYYDEQQSSTSNDQNKESEADKSVQDHSDLNKSEQESSELNKSGHVPGNTPSYEQKRKRLLRKIELAKQVRRLDLLFSLLLHNVISSELVQTTYITSFSFH
jgi:hypothetical protein